MYWTELPCSELMVRAFSHPPEIGYIDLFEVEIKRDGPTVIIGFDLIDTLPDKPPIKWGKEFNRCRVGLYCIGVSELVIAGISKIMRAKINFEINEGNNRVRITGDHFNLAFKCLHVSLTGPSVYLSK